MVTGFDEFWKRYPRKVGRLAAMKAYAKARTVNGATQAELLAGIDAYVKHKPAYADYAHPATWLHAGRWMDEWETQAPVVSAGSWMNECQRVHQGECGGDRWRHAMRMQMRDEA